MGVDQEDETGKSWRNPVIAAAVITTVGGIVIALITGAFGLLHDGTPPNSSPGTALATAHAVAPSESASQPVPGPDSAVRILSPRNGATLPSNESVLIEGTATNLAEAGLWISVGRYGTYYISNASPLTVVKGRWEFLDPYVGNSSNLGNFQ